MYVMLRLILMLSLVPGYFLAHAQYLFNAEHVIACTPVKDQASSNTCWSFAANALIESELMRQDRGTFDLSEMYVVRQVYLDKAFRYLMRQGKANFGDGSLAHDVTRTIEQHGIVPEEAYSGLGNGAKSHDHGELSAVLQGILKALAGRNDLTPHWREVVNAVLDVYLGPVPETFTYQDKTYTPASFTESLDLEVGAYVNLTSFSHTPFYQSFVLDIPDNYANGSYFNVPLEDLAATVDHALSQGYTVVWDGDVSERGFSGNAGLAVMPAVKRSDALTTPGPELLPDQDLRQQLYESLATTDDHLMQLVGKATDQHDTPYYLAKNSWGTDSDRNGYLYMSASYFALKTIAVTLHRDAIPQHIAAKISL